MTGKEKGYEIRFDEANAILRTRYWGFWDSALGAQFKAEFEQHIKDLSRVCQQWYLLANLTQFPPQSTEIQRILTEAMTFAKKHGMQKSARIAESAITKLQFERLSKETHLLEYSFFHTEAEAMRWLLS